jgi:hypothetical protein
MAEFQEYVRSMSAVSGGPFWAIGTVDYKAFLEFPEALFPWGRLSSVLSSPL